jgi:kinesin family member 5
MSRRDASKETVKVVCRVRPQIANEVAAGGVTCVNLTDTSIEVNHDDGSNSFGFDRVFGMDSKQEDVFNYCATPLIHDVLNGYNATIFACK